MYISVTWASYQYTDLELVCLGGACHPAFLTNSQVILTLLVYGSHLVKQDMRMLFKNFCWGRLRVWGLCSLTISLPTREQMEVVYKVQIVGFLFFLISLSNLGYVYEDKKIT